MLQGGYTTCGQACDAASKSGMIGEVRTVISAEAAFEPAPLRRPYAPPVSAPRCIGATLRLYDPPPFDPIGLPRPADAAALPNVAGPYDVGAYELQSASLFRDSFESPP
jgi:hypothetical protein